MAGAASRPPRYRFNSLEAGRIKVHFHREVEKAARRTMALVLEILPTLEERYRVRIPSLEVVVHDAFDAPNGSATSFPYPLVEIRVASFDGADTGPTESWLRLVITHELTHIVHLEQAGGIYGVGRRLFGRAPFLFPNVLQPSWFIEGLAVREETRGTAFGRGRQVMTKMVVDEAARGGELARIDQATLGLDLWPLGNAPYLFGEEFLRFVETEFGEGSTRDIALAHGASVRPYLDEKTFRKTIGRSLTPLWRAFAAQRVASLRAFGTPDLLTLRGAVQTSPRLSPDGSTLAYTSRPLDRLGEIRLMNPDGSRDRRLTSRISGSNLSWSRDGSFIVFDETNQFRKFESRSDLYRVDVRTGARKRLTRGLRASDPDAGPPAGPGIPIVFVQRMADRSELSILSESGAVRVLTASSAGTEWSHPRFSPRGDAIVAARLQDGFLDLVLVEPFNGALRPLTRDRALDAEPAWVDNDTVIFRSDREAESFRLFLVDRDGSNLRSLQGSPENAFAPEVDLAARRVFYAHYSARGYDIARLGFAEGAPVSPFPDNYPAPVVEPEPFVGPSTPYRPLGALRPRFVSPFAEVVSDEWRVGLVTASVDPLLRTAYGIAGSWGTEVQKPNFLAYLRYDRFTPTLTFLGRAEASPSSAGPLDLKEGRLSVDFPIERSVLRAQTLSLIARRRREELVGGTLDTGLLALAWQLDSTRQYPMSISPRDGVRVRAALTRELKAFGSDLDFGKAVLDLTGYTSLGPSVLVSRLGAGWAFGPRVPRSAFAIGGLASPALLDPVGDEPAVLRGYEAPQAADTSRFGKHIAFGNLEVRVPLGHPQRGLRALPFFVRHLHATAGLDAAVVSSGSLDLGTARVGASFGLGADLFLGHRIPVTLQGGVGFGLTRERAIVPWFAIGFPF